MLAGWLTSELAPHLLGGRGGRHGLPSWPAAAAQPWASRSPPRSTAGLGAVVVQSVRRPGATWTARWSRRSARTTPTGSRRRTPTSTCPRPLGQLAMPFRVDHGRGRGGPRRALRRPRPTRAARRLPAARRRPRRAPGAAAGARRRLDHRQQGPPGAAADAAHGGARLGLRGDQLPAQPPRPLPRAARRRQARDRLGPRARVRRTARTRRSSRSPAARPAATWPSLAALTPNDPEYQPGFEDADTTV